MTPQSCVRLAAFVIVLGVGGIACHDVHFDSQADPAVIDLYDHLYAVSVPSAEKAVAVGYRSAIYASDDGGTSWHERNVSWDDPPPPQKPLLYDIAMSDPERGWIVGQLGKVIRTKDGGQTWTPQSNPKADSGFHLFSVQALDANTAWAIGVWGSRIKTEDGGASWQDHSLTIDTEHPQYVWLSPPEQERVRSGEMVFEDVSLNDIYCRPAPSTSCWIVGEFGYIFWSDDHGKQWNRAEIVGTDKFEPITFGYDDSDISDEDAERLKEFVQMVLTQEHLNLLIESFGSAREMRAFVGDGDPSALFDILDSRAVGVRAIVEETGILSDRLRMRGTPPWDYEDFLEDDPTFLQRYLDGRLAEESRVTIDIAQNPYLFRVRFSDDQNGIITGLGGVVLMSDNGGRTWRYGDSGTKQAFYAVAPSDSLALALGEKGNARQSTDGGRTWGPLTDVEIPEIFTFMRDIDFEPNGQTGMIVGQNGLVMRSTDSGKKWEKVLPKPKVAKADTGH
jgi:photosystem II stability/assembly factor-like uncharacterized protein